MKKLAFLIGVFCSLYVFGAGASPSLIDSASVKPHRLSLTLVQGFLAAHHSSMEVMMQHPVRALLVDYGFKPYGERNWESFYGYPEYGIGAFYYNLGSPKYLGSAIGLLPYIAFPLLRPHTWGGLTFKFGIGASYIENTWSRFSNYKNTAIGSHVNATARFELSGNFSVSDSWLLNGGISFTHMSNGSTNNPNSGINMPSVNLGATYCFGEERRVISYREISYSRRLSYLLLITGGIKDVFPQGVGHYPVLGISNNLLKPLSPYTSVTATWDIMYDGSHRELLKYDGDTVSFAKMIKTGLTLGYRLQFGKVTASFQFGHYIYSYYKTGGLFYQRLGLSYELVPRTYLLVALRTSWSNADCIEFGIGHKFGRR